MSIIGVALAILIFMNPFSTPKLLMIIIGITLIVAAVTGIYNRIRIRQAKKFILNVKKEFDNITPDLNNIKSVGSDEDNKE